jgi:hypothetical protein
MQSPTLVVYGTAARKPFDVIQSGAEQGEKVFNNVFMSVGLQGSCILFCIYDRLAHRRLFSLTRLLFSYLSLTRALFSLLRIYLHILGSLLLGNYRSRAP